MVSDFHALAQAFLPDGHGLERSTGCGEKGKSFPINRSDADDEIIRFKLNEWAIWGEGAKSCDCLFLCKKSKSSRFVVVLVELKGDDTKSTFRQIASTTELLCRKSSFKSAGHGKACVEPKEIEHAGRVIAYIVASSGGKVGGMWQAEAAKLKPKKILMQRVHKPGNHITVDELYKQAFGEVS